MAAGLALCALAAGAAAQTAGADTVERLARDGGAFKIGFRTDAPPFSRALTAEELELRAGSARAAGAPPAVGYSIELCERIGEAVVAATKPAAVTVTYLPVTAEDRFDALENGEIDLLCGATTFTLERQRRFDFSLFTFVTSSSLLHRRNATPRGFYGETVGVIKNSTSLEALRRETAQFEPPLRIVQVDSHRDGVEKLRAEEIDSYFGDRVLLRNFMLTNGSFDLSGGATQVVPRRDREFDLSRLRLSNEPYALPMRKGEERLKYLANRTLAELYYGGSEADIYVIFGRWFEGARPESSLAALFDLMAVPMGAPPAP